MSFLSLEKVCKFYGSRSAVVDFSLDVQSRERVVLFGPSGCGKTTVLRLIAGLTAPDSGRIFLRGQLVSKPRKILVPPEKRGLGMVFQELALWPHMTVRENIAFGLWRLPAEERRHRVDQMLRLVGLEDYQSSKPHQLSGGQQQRVALARALATQPDLLLMDEPLSSLDSRLKQKLAREIVRLQASFGFALVYVTHDESEAQIIGNRIVLMTES